MISAQRLLRWADGWIRKGLTELAIRDVEREILRLHEEVEFARAVCGPDDAALRRKIACLSEAHDLYDRLIGGAA